MPNHVYNSVNVHGSAEDLLAFKKKASTPHQTEFKGKRVQDAEGNWGYDSEAIVIEEVSDPFSFWNFIKPEDEILPIYFGHEKVAKPEGYEDWTMEAKFSHDLKFTGNNAYDWNIRNWGTKWDAYDVNLDPFEIGGILKSLSYSFTTAWSIPEQVFRAMCEQHPELSFSFESEEEQGWGAAFESSAVDGAEDGEPTSTLLMTNEWDIPECHQDYVDRGKDCWACEEGDEENLYSDCPREKTEFAVVVQRTFMVKAETAEKAWEIANAGLLQSLAITIPDSEDDVEQADEDFIFVKDIDTNARLFPTLDGGE